MTILLAPRQRHPCSGVPGLASFGRPSVAASLCPRPCSPRTESSRGNHARTACGGAAPSTPEQGFRAVRGHGWWEADGPDAARSSADPSLLCCREKGRGLSEHGNGPAASQQDPWPAVETAGVTLAGEMVRCQAR